MAVPKALCNFREIVGVKEHFFVINEPFSIDSASALQTQDWFGLLVLKRKVALVWLTQHTDVELQVQRRLSLTGWSFTHPLFVGAAISSRRERKIFRIIFQAFHLSKDVGPLSCQLLGLRSDESGTRILHQGGEHVEEGDTEKPVNSLDIAHLWHRRLKSED